MAEVEALILAAAVLLLAATQPAETFYLVGVNEDVAVVVDRSTVRVNGARRGAMLTMIFAKPKLAFGREIRLADMLMEFDCSARTSRSLRMIGRTADGDYVGEDSRPDGWEPVAGPMAEAEALICRGRLPKLKPEASARVFSRAYLNMMAERAAR